MGALQRFINILVATSIFTACCALGLYISTERLVAPNEGMLLSAQHAVVFGSTLVVYNLPRLIPRPYGKPRLHQPLRMWYWAVFVGGVIITAVAALYLPIAIIGICAMMAVPAFLYFLPALPGKRKRLRDFGLVKIVVLTSVWTVATGILPMVSSHATISDYPFEIALRFVFIFALCVLFDIKDMQTDKANNINTLPHRTGEQRAYRLVYASLVVFVGLSLVQLLRHPQYPERPVAAIVAGLATTVVALYIHRMRSRVTFVAITDGMMLLYAFIAVLPGVLP